MRSTLNPLRILEESVEHGLEGFLRRHIFKIVGIVIVMLVTLLVGAMLVNAIGTTWSAVVVLAAFLGIRKLVNTYAVVRKR
jgi:hypothetical protein